MGVRSLVLAGLAPRPRPSGASSQAEALSEQALSKTAVELLAQPGLLDGHEHLDAPVEVAGHQVGAAEEELGLAADLEDVEAAVLEVAADDRAHADVLAQAGNARAEHADRARDDLDRGALLRGGVQLLDHRLVGERVHLDPDAGARPGRRGRTGGLIRSISRVRSPNGATSSFWNRAGRPNPVR